MRSPTAPPPVCRLDIFSGKGNHTAANHPVPLLIAKRKRVRVANCLRRKSNFPFTSLFTLLENASTSNSSWCIRLGALHGSMPAEASTRNTLKAALLKYRFSPSITRYPATPPRSQAANMESVGVTPDALDPVDHLLHRSTNPAAPGAANPFWPSARKPNPRPLCPNEKRINHLGR